MELTLSNKNILNCIIWLPQVNVSWFHHWFSCPQDSGDRPAQNANGQSVFSNLCEALYIT